MTTPNLTEILIGQWRDAPKLGGVVRLIQRFTDDAINAVGRIQLMRDIDEAEGVWLDYLGELLGVDRPGVSDPTMDPRFGFDTAGEPFDTAPFRGAAINDAIYPLPDPVYQRMVKARAVAVLSDGTIYSFAKAVKEVDANANVYDFRNMSVMIGTDNRRFMRLADQIGALPRTAGVQVLYGDKVEAGGTFPAFTATLTVGKR